MNNKEVEFKLEDKVTSHSTNEKGMIARLCADKGVIFVRWDKDNSLEMVETKSLKKIK